MVWAWAVDWVAVRMPMADDSVSIPRAAVSAVFFIMSYVLCFCLA